MQKWQQGADKDIVQLAKKARKEGEKEEARRMKETIAKVNSVISKKSKETSAEKKAEQKIQAEANKLTQKIEKDPNLNQHEKAQTINEVKNEVRAAISNIYGRPKKPVPVPPKQEGWDKCNAWTENPLTAKISDKDIQLVKKHIPEVGDMFEKVVKPNKEQKKPEEVTPPADAAAAAAAAAANPTPAPPAAAS